MESPSWAFITDFRPMNKRCPRCGVTKHLFDFHKSKAKRDGYNVLCKLCSKQAALDWRNQPKGRARQMVTTAMKRAYEKGWDFDLTPEWVQPKLEVGLCEVTKLPLELSGGEYKGYGHFRPWTPSLDRIDPTKGYTTDNVQVVCWIYNQAKGVGTHADVLRLASSLKSNDN